MKTTTILVTIITATISFTTSAANIEATFDRDVEAVCYVTQSNKVEGKLTFSNEQTAPESIEVFSNTGKVELTYKSVKVNDGDFTKNDINFRINNDVVTIGDEVEVNQGLIDLGMSLDQTVSDFVAGSTLSATATLVIECEDNLSDSNGNSGNNGNGNGNSGNNGNGQCPDGEEWDKEDQECDD